MLLPELVQELGQLLHQCVVELRDFDRKCCVEFRQRIARAQRAHDLDEIAIGRARRRIGREPGAHLLDGLGRAERVLERFDDLDLKGSCRLLCLALLVGRNQVFHLRVEIARHRRQQVAGDPLPDRPKRAAGNPPRIGVLRRALDKQIVHRSEEISRGIAGAGLGRSVLAELRAQPRLDIGRPRHVDAAMFQPLKLAEQATARQRGQTLDEIP